MISFRLNGDFDTTRKNYPGVADSTLKEEFTAKRNSLKDKIDRFGKEMDDYRARHNTLNFDLPKKFNEFHVANDPESLQKVVNMNLDWKSPEEVRQGISDMEHFETELENFQRELSRLSKPEMGLVVKHEDNGLKGGCQPNSIFMDLLGKSFQMSRGYLAFGLMTFINKLILALLPPGTSQQVKDAVNVLCILVAVMLHEKCSAATGATVPSMYLRNPANNFWKDLGTEKLPWLMFTFSRLVETAVVKAMSDNMHPSFAKKMADAFLSVIFTYVIAGLGVPLWQQAGRYWLGGKLHQNDLNSSQFCEFLKKVFASCSGFDVKGKNLEYYGGGVFSMIGKAAMLLGIWFPLNKLVFPSLFPAPFSSNNSTNLQIVLANHNDTMLQEFLEQMQSFLHPDNFNLLNKTLHELGPITNSTEQEISDHMNADSTYALMSFSDLMFIGGSWMFYNLFSQILRWMCCVNKTPWKEVWNGRQIPALGENPVVPNRTQSELNSMGTMINPIYTQTNGQFQLNNNTLANEGGQNQVVLNIEMPGELNDPQHTETDVVDTQSQLNTHISENEEGQTNIAPAIRLKPSHLSSAKSPEK